MSTLTNSRRIALLVVCLAAACIEGYDIQAYGVAAPSIAGEFGLTPQQQGWLAGITMLGLVVGAFLGGHVADRAGRKWVLGASVVIFGVFSLATGVADSVPFLFAARLASGLGFGSAMPTLIAIAGDVSSARNRAMTVTLVFCGLPAGAALVSLLARSMGESLDWRLIFIIGGIAPLALAPLVFWIVPGGTAAKATPGATGLRALLGEGRAGKTVLIWSIFIVTLLLVHLMLNWLPSLVVAKGFTVSNGATAAMTFNLASIAGAFAIAALVDRIGFRWPLAVAYGLLAGAIVLLSASATLNLVIMLSAAAGFLVVGPQCALYALVPSVYPAHARAFGAGAAVGMGRLGSILGPIIAGDLRAAGLSANQVLLTIAPLALIASLAALALGALIRRRDAPLTKVVGSRST